MQIPTALNTYRLQDFPLASVFTHAYNIDQFHPAQIKSDVKQ